MPRATNGPTSLEPFDRCGGKRLVFCVTTGRSGTKLLARALNAYRGVTARHEPKPTFSSAFRAVLAAPAVAREFWERSKLPRIARERGSTYVETSHVFGLGFLPDLLALGARPGLILLRREPSEVARSLWCLGDIPGRSLKGIKYYLSPFDVSRDADGLDPRKVERWHDYQLCYWYALELDRRAALAREECHRLGLMAVDLAYPELLHPAGVMRCAQALGFSALSAPRRLWLARRLERRVNERRDRKRAWSLEPEFVAQLEREVEALERTR